MNESTENTQELPTIAPTQDDIASRWASRRAELMPGRSRNSAMVIVTSLVLVLLTLGVFVSGWFIVTQNNSLAQMRLDRDQAVARLERIEQRLSLTDEALNQADAETQDKLAFWSEEIHKLWDVSNKRNRGWIEANQAALAKLQKQREKQTQALDRLHVEVKELRRTLSTQEAILREQIDQSTTEILRQQRVLTDSVTTMEQGVAVLERRVTGNEEAVQAIDGFRRETNMRFTRLQERVDQAISSVKKMEQRMAAPGGSGASRVATPVTEPSAIPIPVLVTP